MKNVRPNQFVVVSDAVDTQVYRVKSQVNERIFTLEYKTKNGVVCNGGEIDISCLKRPTTAQLMRTLNELY